MHRTVGIQPLLALVQKQRSCHLLLRKIRTSNVLLLLMQVLRQVLMQQINHNQREIADAATDQPASVVVVVVHAVLSSEGNFGAGADHTHRQQQDPRLE